ncbi:uncharacterized protein EHS24_008520 [Apiotrichum porosum]|uniref:CENP-V/GFA domain-containing protein n=1 Tax=Apiotrichum porosum TaxID=105984 RepID=A0A427XQF1_9TREE|nr:uncharacterized protein EHS24_008520 [Apiotrichum porosum]RSH81086.1 hypothetical protein EHS24_008520 [Apiotrichum porosum]
MPQIQGSCLCKQITITVKDRSAADKAGVEICHCTDCRQFTGAPAGYLVQVPHADAEISGTPKQFSVTAESGNTVVRNFCANCGSSLFDEGATKGKYFIHGGIFPPKSLPQPTMELWMRSAESWERPFPGVELYEKQQ